VTDQRSCAPSPAPEDAARALSDLFLHDSVRFDETARALAKANRSVDIPITGGSMGSTLPAGSVVRVSLAGGEVCGVADVVVFRQSEQIVAHRVIHIAPRHLITRGDARTAPDPPVPFDRVLGRVAGVISSDGSLKSLPASPRGRWLARLARSIAFRMTVMMLRVSPALAGRSIGLLTAIERLSLLARKGAAAV
jgi:hypothetical protein